MTRGIGGQIEMASKRCLVCKVRQCAEVAIILCATGYRIKTHHLSIIDTDASRLPKLALLLLPTLLKLLRFLVRLLHRHTSLPLLILARLHTDGHAVRSALLGRFANLALGVFPFGGACFDGVPDKKQSVRALCYWYGYSERAYLSKGRASINALALSLSSRRASSPPSRSSSSRSFSKGWNLCGTSAPTS
jgi:hypothetical protein